MSYIFKDIPKCPMGYPTEYIMFMCWLSFSCTQKPCVIHRVCKKLLRRLKLRIPKTYSNVDKEMDSC